MPEVLSTPSQSALARRTVLKGAAWSAPLLITSTALPAYAASLPVVASLLLSFPSAVDAGTVNVATVTALDARSQPVPGALVALTGGSSVTLVSDRLSFHSPSEGVTDSAGQFRVQVFVSSNVYGFTYKLSATSGAAVATAEFIAKVITTSGTSSWVTYPWLSLPKTPVSGAWATLRGGTTFTAEQSGYGPYPEPSFFKVMDIPTPMSGQTGWFWTGRKLGVSVPATGSASTPMSVPAPVAVGDILSGYDLVLSNNNSAVSLPNNVTVTLPTLASPVAPPLNKVTWTFFGYKANGTADTSSTLAMFKAP